MNRFLAMLGVQSDEERAERRARLDEQTQEARHEVNQSIQVMRSGAELMSTFSGMNKLVREAGRANPR